MQPLRFKWSLLHPRHWMIWLGFSIMWVVVMCSPYRFLMYLAAELGKAVARLNGRRVRIVRRNLELCFPELSAAERKELLEKNCIEMTKSGFEMLISWWWPAWRLKKLAKIEGIEHLQQAHAQGVGVVLMAAHMTNLEIGAALLGQLHTIDGMYRPHKNPVYDYLQRKGRERHNADATAIERKDVRAMIKVLRQGRAIWYAPDQDYGRKHSVFVPFFGIQAATVTATSKFARLGKALVIPMRQERMANGKGHRIVIEPALENFPGQTVEEDCLRINQWVEQVVRANPEQYLWAHRRFKTRPEGEPWLY